MRPGLPKFPGDTLTRDSGSPFCQVRTAVGALVGIDAAPVVLPTDARYKAIGLAGSTIDTRID